MDSKDANAVTTTQYVVNTSEIIDGSSPNPPSVFSVMSLHLLDATAKNEDKLINYLLACRNEDGGYAIIPGAESDM